MKMQDNNFHRNFRDHLPLSLLFAAFGKTFPHFLISREVEAVDNGAKLEREKVFHALKAFSTSFPHMHVDDGSQ
jgi:hypothetical protein